MDWKSNLEQEQEDRPLPELTEGQAIEVSAAAVKEGKTMPPKRYTEDAEYDEAKKEMRELLVHKANVEYILGLEEQEKAKIQTREREAK